MCFRDVYLFIAFSVIIGKAFCGVHSSNKLNIPCDILQNEHSKLQPDVDSFLLSEGESLTLDCGVCTACSNAPPECKDGYDSGEWKIQTTRHLGYGEHSKGKIDDASFDLYKIRLRLHERIWPHLTGVPKWVHKVVFAQIHMYENQQLGTINGGSAKRDNIMEQNSTQSLLDAPGLYIFVAKPNEPGYVLTTKHGKFDRGRIKFIRDKMIIQQTRLEDTGMYYCHFNGRKIREWAVTVISALDEPFRYLTRPLDYDSSTMELIRENASMAAEMPNYPHAQVLTEPMKEKRLLKFNLRLYTDWSNWTACVPCTSPNQLPRTTEPGGDGFQIRVGICRVTLLDSFHSVRPHDLALQIDTLLRQHFRRGLPCRSHLIRDAMRLFGPKAVILRPNEIMVRECVHVCHPNDLSHVRYKLPKRIHIRVNEGENLVISCPVRGAVQAPISWFYSPRETETLVRLTKKATSKDIISKYGSPSRYLTKVLNQVDIVNLFESTRGRFRFDQAHNLIMAEAIANPPREEEKQLHHLICIHGDARASRRTGFSDWAGIIEVEVVPRTYAVVVISKVSQVVLLLIPFALALGTFFVIALTLHTERKPNMRAAADGFTNKPPP